MKHVNFHIQSSCTVQYRLSIDVVVSSRLVRVVVSFRLPIAVESTELYSEQLNATDLNK